uniref:AB hydrolase-1 domain-containing protein n=1 Tax=Branchiostoma floridae TaxID=7739 RepID=C3Y1P9_BRAFL|eukprot:XP_002609779.1 hypothetical protein BRAFLDRAFT_122100 [Branchiostoma floridae]
MEVFFGAAVLVLCYVFLRLLNLSNGPAPPTLYYRPSDLNEFLLQTVPLLTLRYTPPILWGRNGHLQSIIHSLFGPSRSKESRTGECFSVQLEDGSTLTYTLYDTSKPHPAGDITIVVCPGFGSSNRSKYIQAFVSLVSDHGYKVAVLDHLGTTDNPLTARRIFTYGETGEFGAMVDDVMRENTTTRLIVVGFSMGANIVCKYMAEGRPHNRRVICCVSAGQGYDAVRGSNVLMEWTGFRRAYNFAMAQGLKTILQRHSYVLFRGNSDFNLSAIQSATSLQEIDLAYTLQAGGYSSLHSYYRHCSCKFTMHKITVPTLLVNALDDPLIPEDMLDVPYNYAMSRDNAMFVLTRHGGHLGFYSGGLIIPDSETWLHRLLLQYLDAMSTIALDQSKVKASTDSLLSSSSAFENLSLCASSNVGTPVD